MSNSSAAAWDAVSYLLASPSLGGRCRPLHDEGGFDWPALLDEAEAMSNGQRLLVHVAHELWEGEGLVGLSKLARGLDRANFERLMTALRIYRGDEVREPAPVRHLVSTTS
jgi:hypothetical protein